MISSVNWSVLGITAHYSPPGREGEREGGGNLEASERSQLAVAVWPLTRAFSSAVRPSAARMCKRKASFGPVSSSSIHRRHSSCPFHAALCKDVCPASLVKVKSMPLSKIHLHVTTYARREASHVSEVTLGSWCAYKHGIMLAAAHWLAHQELCARHRRLRE